MNSLEPPLVATWLLDHLLVGGKKEALAGDLLEEFNRRRSTAWYWRQVLFAIAVGFSKELCSLLPEAGFAAVLFITLHLGWWRIVVSPTYKYLVRAGTGRDRPLPYLLAVSLGSHILIAWVGLHFTSR